ncbi:MAG: hypothetical protein H7836_05555 [Magnetococcus sp. YQC-3]
MIRWWYTRLSMLTLFSGVLAGRDAFELLVVGVVPRRTVWTRGVRVAAGWRCFWRVGCR